MLECVVCGAVGLEGAFGTYNQCRGIIAIGGTNSNGRARGICAECTRRAVAEFARAARAAFP